MQSTSMTELLQPPLVLLPVCCVLRSFASCPGAPARFAATVSKPACSSAASSCRSWLLPAATRSYLAIWQHLLHNRIIYLPVANALLVCSYSETAYSLNCLFRNSQAICELGCFMCPGVRVLKLWRTWDLGSGWGSTTKHCSLSLFVGGAAGGGSSSVLGVGSGSATAAPAAPADSTTRSRHN